MDKEVLENRIHRICLNHAQIAAHAYDNHSSTLDRSTVINRVVKDVKSNVKMNGLKGLLRFRMVAPQLVRLLGSGGIWTIDCEEAYMALTKCRVEQVSIYLRSSLDAHTLNSLVN
jgi:hypothetical protein